MIPGSTRSARPAARLAALAAAALAAGCGQSSLDVAPPLDRTFFPTGVAAHRLPDGRTALLVASSNFDLSYAREEGGTLLSIDAAGSVPADPEQLERGLPPVVLGGVVIDSFAGEVALADPAAAAGSPGACPGSAGTYALVPTRIRNTLHAVKVDAAGALSCGEGCRVPLDARFRSAYSVTVACGSSLGPRAFVSHLEAKPSEADGIVHGWITEVDLSSTPGPTALPPLDLGGGASTVRTVRWDPAASRLFATPVSGTLGFSAFRWLYPSARVEGRFPVEAVDFDDLVRNGVAQDVAFSSDGTKLYVTVVLNDPSFISTAGVLVPVAGALAVLEVRPGELGVLELRVLRVVPMGTGPGPLQVLPRAGRGDLVAVTDTTGNDVFLYDDDAGAVVRAFGRDRFGRPVAGRQPFGLASEKLASGVDRLYVGSFGEGIVTVIDVDPAAPHAAAVVKRIGVRP